MTLYPHSYDQKNGQLLITLVSGIFSLQTVQIWEVAILEKG